MNQLAQLVEHWHAAGIAVPGGASAAAIAEFEDANNVVLPNDFAAYFRAVDGMGDRGVCDNEMFSFWRLDDIVTIADDVPDRADKYPDANTYYMFADHSISLPTFAIRLFADPSKPTPIASVITDFGALDVEIVFNSFSEFVNIYLDNPISLAAAIPESTARRLNGET